MFVDFRFAVRVNRYELVLGPGRHTLDSRYQRASDGAFGRVWA